MKVLKPTSDDTVRERMAELEKTNRSLELENEGLRAQLASAQQERSEPEIKLADATPRLTEVTIQSSSVVETTTEGARQLVLRLSPIDDRARFLQIVGSLDVRVVAIPNEGQPVQLASARFEPGAVRDAWRGGTFGASGYVFDIPLTVKSGMALPPTVAVVTVFTEGGTGRTLRDERPVRVLADSAG